MANIGVDIFNGFNSARAEALISMDDWADRLSYLYSVLILSISIAVVTVKTYFFSPLSCYVATKPGGSSFSSYLTELCLVQGTIPLGEGENLPSSLEAWTNAELERRVNYYYWIPFVLGLQMMFFYMPHLLWSMISNRKLGYSLTHLLEQAQTARKIINPSQRREANRSIAESISMLLWTHRRINDNWLSSIKKCFGGFCGFLLCSKRMGSWTVASYLTIKLLYLANAIGQLFLMKKFLNFSDDVYSFGLELASRISLVDDWKNSSYFPRTSVCRINIRLTGAKYNTYVGICAMPINLFNEKIYVFLWFWVTYVCICTAISIPVWLVNIGSSSRRLKRLKIYFQIEKIEHMISKKMNEELSYIPEPKETGDYKEDLKNQDAYLDKVDAIKKVQEDLINLVKEYSPTDKTELVKFSNNFLRPDGLFILDMIDQHVGEIITGEIVRYLWLDYIQDYYDMDFNQYHEESFDEEYSPIGSHQQSEKSSSLQEEGSTLRRTTLRTDEV